MHDATMKVWLYYFGKITSALERTQKSKFSYRKLRMSRCAVLYWVEQRMVQLLTRIKWMQLNECMQFHVTNPLSNVQKCSHHKSHLSVTLFCIETVRCETGDDTNLKTTNLAALAMKTAVPLWRNSVTFDGYRLSRIAPHPYWRYVTVQGKITISIEI